MRRDSWEGTRNRRDSRGQQRGEERPWHNSKQQAGLWGGDRTRALGGRDRVWSRRDSNRGPRTLLPLTSFLVLFKHLSKSPKALPSHNMEPLMHTKGSGGNTWIKPDVVS